MVGGNSMSESSESIISKSQFTMGTADFLGLPRRLFEEDYYVLIIGVLGSCFRIVSSLIVDYIREDSGLPANCTDDCRIDEVSGRTAN